VKCGYERSRVAQVDHADRRNLYLPWNPVAKERPPRVPKKGASESAWQGDGKRTE